MTKEKLPKWTEERTEALLSIVGNETPVSVEKVEEAANALDTSTRSVASKLRSLGLSVESKPTTKGKIFSPEEENRLKNFVEKNPGKYTYAEIAALVFGDDYSARSVQGKLLHMKLTDLVKRTPAKEATKTYTDEEEAIYIKMAGNGAYLEDIADALGRSVRSVQGKALSMLRSHDIPIPKRKTSNAKEKVDILDGVDVENMTVEEIADTIDRSPRGVKTMLTHRGLSAKDYNGAARKAKLEKKKAESAQEAQ